MTRDKFIASAVSSGYCSMKEAREYEPAKTDLTEFDYIEVYRIHQKKTNITELDHVKFRNYDGAKSTKRFMTEYGG